MSELTLLGCIAGIATAGLAVAFAPLRSTVATAIAAILVPVLLLCVLSAFRLAAFCAGDCEPIDAVGELDLWMAGLILYGIGAAMTCVARVVIRLIRKPEQSPMDQHLA